MKIGVISDTHNYFDPQIPRLLAGVEHILHAGDIGLPRVLLELERIAPVTSVGGNNDDFGFAFRFFAAVSLANRKFLLHHIVNPHAPSEALLERLERDQPEVVVFGHTHKPSCETVNGVLFFNPGYAGKSRLGMSRSLGILYCEDGGIRWEHLPL